MIDEETQNVLPLVEEVATLDKRAVTERVRIHTAVEIETKHLEADLLSQAVRVERRTMDVEVDKAPPVRSENGVTIVPILEERLVVTKQLHLIGELHITTSQVTERVDFSVELQRQNVTVDRSSA